MRPGKNWTSDSNASCDQGIGRGLDALRLKVLLSHVAMTKGALLARIGVWMQVAQLVGVAFSVWCLMRGLNIIGTTGVDGPTSLSIAIGAVLDSMPASLAAGLIGCILLTISITTYRYREKWIFWFLVTYGVLFTPFGLFFLIYCLIKRKEFLQPVPIAVL
jgi:hypothetical protein